MTDHDDRLRRRYREIATEEPSAVIDAAILARARAARPARSRWMGPVSIAAVLVLGIGVALRMQLEQPGIETSQPVRESASPPSEYSLPPSAEPAAPPAAPPAKPLADAVRVEPAKKAAPVSSPPAPTFVPSPPAAAQSRAAERPARGDEAPALARVQEAPATAAVPQAADAAQGAPLRARREAANLDALGARELRKSAAPDPDPARELERIAKLREDGRHADADSALAEFRKRHPEHRIAEAMWERVKPR